MFSIVVALFYIPTNNTQGFQLLQTLANTYYFLGFLIPAMVICMRWYLVWFWFFICLMISDVAHLSMCLLTIRVSSLHVLFLKLGGGDKAVSSVFIP